jgi:MoxR-like ATPase
MTDSDNNTTLNLEQATAAMQGLREEILKVFIGQDEVVEQVLIALLSGGHVLIEGVPGLGKTLLVRALAEGFGGKFSRIQFTPDLMPTDVTGHVIYDMKNERFTIRRGPIFTHLLLADEINRAPAKTQSALLEVMQEQQVTLEGKAMSVPLPFMTLATQNPIEQEGTYPLPEAQLDRFLLKILIDYPDESREQEMIAQVTKSQIGDQLNVSAISNKLTPELVQQTQQLAAQIQVDRAVNDYAVSIVRTTRNWQGISVGAGPRGAIALIRAGRANALLNGRDFVTPDDIKHIALPALRHRILLSPELELEGHTTDEVLHGLLDKVEAPRQ